MCHDEIAMAVHIPGKFKLAVMQLCKCVEITLNPQSSRASMLPAKAPTLCWKAGLLSLMFLNLSWLGSLYMLAKYFCIVWKQVVTPALLSGFDFFISTSFALSFSATADKGGTVLHQCACLTERLMVLHDY